MPVKKGGSIVQDNVIADGARAAEGGVPVRIIPCLDMKDGRVVKGINFVSLRDAGDPVENALYYQQEGADQLAMLDIAATVENRKTRVQWAGQVASVIDIPLVMGGGISDLADMDALFEVGVAAVSVNSAAVARPELVKEAVEAYGAERIIVAIDGKRNAAMPSGFEVVVSGGQKPTGVDAVEWARRCEALGTGELLPTSMDGDGTLAGYDLPFTRGIAEAVRIPVIASGGAGTLEHFFEGVVEGKASALLAASVFHFRTFTVRQVKEYLAGRGIPVRLSGVSPGGNAGTAARSR